MERGGGGGLEGVSMALKVSDKNTRCVEKRLDHFTLQNYTTRYFMLHRKIPLELEAITSERWFGCWKSRQQQKTGSA